jgi:hypothetical protein
MWAVLSVASAAAAGTALGLARLKVWAVVPTIVIFSLIATAIGSGVGLNFGRIALIVFAGITVVQVSYLIGAVLSEATTRERVSDRVPAKQELLRIMRTAIGEDLRAYFEVPLDAVPPQLRQKLALLEAR